MNRSPQHRLAWLLLAIAIVSGCRSGDGDGHRIMAPPPGRAQDREPAPAAELPPSVVDAPLTLNLSSALAVLDSALPRRFGDLTERQRIPGRRRATYAYQVSREPFTAAFRGDTILVSSVIHYQGRGWYDPPIAPEIGGSCGTDGPPPRARVVLAIHARLTADWRLEARSRLASVEPVTRESRDQCQVTFLKLDVTEKVLRAARDALAGQLPKVDARLTALDVRGAFEGIWLEMQRPIRLADSVWLMLQPSGVRLGRLRGNRQAMGAPVGITVRPKIETGPKPLLVAVPLPALDTMEAGQGLNLLVEGRFDYPRISDMLTRTLSGRRIQVAGRVFEVEQMGAFGIGAGMLALGVRFGGSASGQIYFVGRPRYDPRSDQISVPDLDYDASSAGLLVRGLAWLKDDDIRDFLRQRASFPSGDALGRLAALAMKGLNRDLVPGVRLRAEITGTEVMRIQPRAEALILQARAFGSAGLELNGQVFTKLQR